MLKIFAKKLGLGFRIALYGFFGVLILLVVSFYSIQHMAKAQWQAIENHFLNHKDAIVVDAISLIDSLSGVSERSLDVDSLPLSLKAQGVRFAQVLPTHINLIVYTNPDTTSGFRIWPSNPSPDYEDKATSVPNVTRYRYCNDYPMSPSNQP